LGEYLLIGFMYDNSFKTVFITLLPLGMVFSEGLHPAHARFETAISNENALCYVCL
jgi:hypothetical protein